MTRCASFVLGVCVSALVLASGCATSVPAFAGASTTPHDRVDVLAGMTARVATGDLVDQDATLAQIAPQGVAPAGAARVGLDGGWDLGLVVAGPSGRAELRHAARLSTYTRFHVGVGAYAGYAGSMGGLEAPSSTLHGEGWRAGLSVPAVIGIEIGSLVEGWFGVRVGAEHVEGTDLDARRSDAWALRGGGVLGVALGLRRVHVLAELAVDGEWWKGTTGSVALERAGVVLTPAFGVRVRF